MQDGVRKVGVGIGGVLIVLMLLIPRSGVAQQPSPIDEARIIGTTDSARSAGLRASEVRDLARIGPSLETAGVRVADAHLRTQMAHGLDDATRAVQAYRAILARAGASLRSSADSVVRRHVAQLAPILPQNVKQKLVRGTPEGPVDAWTLAPGAGDRLLRWWRRQDPLPGTERNERLIEHLRRVADARHQFACSVPECQPEQWDERGTVYVRFGSPSRRHAVRYNEAEFNLDVFRFGVPVSRHDFPDNELWIYPQIDDAGKYLFVKKDGYYQRSPTSDLLPPLLRSGYGGQTDRVMNKAVSALAALRHIYKQLSQHHVDYAERYSTIADYASWQQEQADLVDMGVLSSSGTRTVGSGVGQQRTVGPGPPGPNSGYPNEFVSSHLRASESRDHEDAQRREKRMPTQYSRVSEDVPALPVAVRTARFLTEAGSTEVRVAWSHPPGALALPERTLSTLDDAGIRDPDGHLIRLRAVQQDTAFRRGPAYDHRYFVERGPHNPRTPVDVQTFTMTGDTDPFHLSIQWDQRVALDREAQRIRRGPIARRAVHRIDSLRALPDSGDELVMSDVMPGRLPEGRPPRKEHVTPYPFSSLGDDRRLALSFEVYNLQHDATGETTYTVAYRVERVTKKEGLRGLFGGEERSETVMRSTYRGTRSRTEEFITLDLEQWNLEGEGTLAVTVRVTDEIRGEHVQRTITFDGGEE